MESDQGSWDRWLRQFGASAERLVQNDREASEWPGSWESDSITAKLCDETSYVTTFAERVESHGGKVDPRLVALASGWMTRYHRCTAGLQLILGSQNCESPIEVAMLVALATTAMDRSRGAKLHPNSDHVFGWEPGVSIVPQYEIGPYRVDFFLSEMVELWTYLPEVDEHVPHHKTAHIVVECDGHDFHERTKEQARRDKKRDRFFQQLGHPVLRFTGSEIYEDPLHCGTQVYDTFDAHQRRMIEAFEEAAKASRT